MSGVFPRSQTFAAVSASAPFASALRLVAGTQAQALAEQHGQAGLDRHGVAHARQIPGVDQQPLDAQGLCHASVCGRMS